MGVNYSSNVVRNGLVLYLDAANTKSYPGSGTTWIDLSGNGNNATLTNGPTFSSANKGSVVFDGSNDIALISDSNSLTSTTALTINCWVKAAAFGGGYSSIIGKGTSDTDEEYCLLIHSSFLYFDVGVNFGPYVQPSYSFATNTWYNICCVHTRSGSSALTAYVNLSQVAGSTAGASLTPNNNSAPVSIGSRFHNSHNGPFNGNIGQISIYNRVLSLVEIRQNFNATRSRYGL